MSIKILIASLLGALSAQAAFANQMCPSRDVVQQYELARDAKRQYTILLGTFGKKPISVARKGALVQFNGKTLAGDGFTRPHKGLVQLIRACVNGGVPCDPRYVPWGQILIFATAGNNRMVVHESLCSEHLIQNPSASELGLLVKCHTSKECLRLGR